MASKGKVAFRRSAVGGRFMEIEVDGVWAGYINKALGNSWFCYPNDPRIGNHVTRYLSGMKDAVREDIRRHLAGDAARTEEGG